MRSRSTPGPRPRGPSGPATRPAPSTPGPRPCPSQPPAWPPAGAERVEPEDLRARLAEAGFEYGPAFQGLTAAWRDGEDLFAEVSLPAERAEEARGFGLHPALLDCGPSRRVAGLAGEGDEACRSPGSGVRPVHRRRRRAAGEGTRRRRGRGPGRLRRHRRPGGGRSTLLARAAIPPDCVPRRRARLLAFRVGWRPLPTTTARPPSLGGRRGPIPSRRPPPPATAAATWRRSSSGSLPSRRGFALGDPHRGALATAGGERPDPATAALAGLIGSAASEHPGRFLLIDTDAGEASREVLEQALAASPRESRLALREGKLLVPRLAPAGEPAGEPPRALNPERTVLITGATGALGALIARHLVEAHGARHLLLVSRSAARPQRAPPSCAAAAGGAGRQGPDRRLRRRRSRAS